MRKFLSFLILCVCVPALLAQAPGIDKMKPAERAKFLAEVNAYKHQFLTKNLDLSEEQQKEFLPMYDSMQEEIEKVINETRDTEKRVSKDKDASDAEIDAATKAIFEQKLKEGNIENEYYQKFRTVLTPRQLLKLKNTERKFMQNLMRHHRRLYNASKK